MSSAKWWQFCLGLNVLNWNIIKFDFSDWLISWSMYHYGIVHIAQQPQIKFQRVFLMGFWKNSVSDKNLDGFLIVRRAGLLWSQQDFEWRWSVPLFKCLTVLEFSFILFDLCLLITFFNFVMNYVPIVTFWIFTYHKIWILSIMFCFIWSYWIIYSLACLEVSWRVVS